MKCLRIDAALAMRQISPLIRAPLTQNQLVALTSFVHNLGAGRLKSSTLRRLINAGDYDRAAGEFGKWVFCNGMPSNGLIIRRKYEKDLFSKK